MRYLLALLLFASAAFADCPAPIPPQRDIIADSYYDDPPVYSHIDPVRHAAYETAVKPLESYLRNVVAMASRGDTQCTLRWLVAWAEGDAMLGKIEKEQAHYERKWMLAGLATGYAKVRDAATGDQRAAIDTWLQAIADGVRAHSEHYKGKRNNHLYWEGLAVGATGAVTGNKADLDWGRRVFDFAMSQIQDDGSLPFEMARGSRALHYHLFAAAPLIALESILDRPSPKLDKLVALCLAGLKDPQFLAARAGVAQIGVNADDADWLVIYARRHPSAEIASYLASRKPHQYRLGGDLSTANPLEHPLTR